MNNTIILHNEEDRSRAIEAIEGIKADGTMQIEIKRRVRGRSIAQNKLLWMWLSLFGSEIGYTHDEMYDIVVDRCWPMGLEEIMFDDKNIPRQRRTSFLTTKEFSEFLTAIDSLAVNQGIILPRPEDLFWESMGLDRK